MNDLSEAFDELQSQRRRKQAYLTERIIAAGHSERDFHAFLLAERPDGEDVGVWTFDELESRVVYFLRDRAKGEERRLFAFERLELGEETLYAQRMPGKLRTKMSTLPSFARVERAEPRGKGFLFSRGLLYTLETPGVGRAQRCEEDFLWLTQALRRECAFVVLPPGGEGPQGATPEAARAQKERFLRGCLAHPALRGSLALEAFLAAPAPEQFLLKVREVDKRCAREGLPRPGLLRREWEAFGSEALETLADMEGPLELKISPELKRQLQLCDAQLARGGEDLEQLSRLLERWDGEANALEAGCARLREAFTEMAATAEKVAAAKASSSRFSLAAAPLFRAGADLLSGLGDELCATRQSMQHVSELCAHLRAYALGVAEAIAQRNAVSNEYYKAKMALNARKERLLTAKDWPTHLDPAALAEVELSSAQLLAVPALARPLLLPAETARLRNYADYFAFVNYSAFHEAEHFERYSAESWLETLGTAWRGACAAAQRKAECWAEVGRRLEAAEQLTLCAL